MNAIHVLQNRSLAKLTENLDDRHNLEILLNLVHIFSLAHPEESVRKQAGEEESRIFKLLQKKSNSPILDLGEERVEFIKNLREDKITVENKEITPQSDEAYQLLTQHSNENVRRIIFEAMNYQSENNILLVERMAGKAQQLANSIGETNWAEYQAKKHLHSSGVEGVEVMLQKYHQSLLTQYQQEYDMLKEEFGEDMMKIYNLPYLKKQYRSNHKNEASPSSNLKDFPENLSLNDALSQIQKWLNQAFLVDMKWEMEKIFGIEMINVMLVEYYSDRKIVIEGGPKIYASIILDSQPREGKYPRGLTTNISRRRNYLPGYAYVNFPCSDPKNLSFSEFKTLCHEMGHAIHYGACLQNIEDKPGVTEIPSEVISDRILQYTQWVSNEKKGNTQHFAAHDAMSDLMFSEMSLSIYQNKKIDYYALTQKYFPGYQMEQVKINYANSTTQLLSKQSQYYQYIVGDSLVPVWQKKSNQELWEAIQNNKWL